MKKYNNGGKAPVGPGGNVNDLLKYLSMYQRAPLNTYAASSMGTEPRPVRNTDELLKELNSRARKVQETRAEQESRRRAAERAYEFYQKNPNAKIEDHYEMMFDSYFGKDWRESSKNRNFNQREIYNGVNSAKVYLQ